MNDNFDLFRGTESFFLSLKKIEQENKDVFEEANISYDECCILSSENNKISLVKVNDKLPTQIQYVIENQWKEFCNNKV